MRTEVSLHIEKYKKHLHLMELEGKYGPLMADTLDLSLSLLDEVLASPEKETLDQVAPKLQELVWDRSSDDSPAWDILGELALDLDYYYGLDPSCYGKDRVMAEIRSARNRLKEILKR